MKFVLKFILGVTLVGGAALGCSQKKENHTNVSPESAGTGTGAESEEDSKKPEPTKNPELAQSLKSANDLLAQELQVRQNLKAMQKAVNPKLREKLFVVFRSRVEQAIEKLNVLASDPEIKSDASAKKFIQVRLDLLKKVKASVIAKNSTQLFSQMEQLDQLFSQD